MKIWHHETCLVCGSDFPCPIVQTFRLTVHKQGPKRTKIDTESTLFIGHQERKYVKLILH